MHVILKAVYQVGKKHETKAEQEELAEIKRTAPKFVPPIPIRDANG